MPRILKLYERQECIKPKLPVWDKDKLQCASSVSEKAVKCLSIPKQFYEAFQDLPQSYSEYTSENEKTLFNLIEEIIRDTMTSNLSDDIFFKDFVEIKEVPKWEI